MYEERVKRLRERAAWINFPHHGEEFPTEDAKLMMEAADAIEELQQIAGHYEESAHNYFKDVCYYLERMPKWIPVTERLPEDGVAVNIVWRNHSPVIYYQHIKDKPQTATGVYYHGRWYWWSAVVQDYLAEYGEWEPDKMDEAIEVTQWQPLPPLPEPPEEATDES